MRKLNFVSKLFPETRNANFDEWGQCLVSCTIAMTPQTVIEAYANGIFPWVDLGSTVGWFVLENRGVLDFSELHIPKRLKSEIKKGKFEVSLDRDFEGVIRNCAQVKRPNEDETWISKKFIKTYTALHRAGYAHSVEVWLAGELVGGLYGTHVQGVFSGESMFHKVPNASKFALLKLIEHLKERGMTWMDTQQVTSFPQQIGAKVISHEAFLDRLEKAHEKPISFYP